MNENTDLHLVGLYRHPEHGKAYIWQKSRGGYDYEVSHIDRKGVEKEKKRFSTSYDDVDKHLRSKGYKAYHEGTYPQNTYGDVPRNVRPSKRGYWQQTLDMLQKKKEAEKEKKQVKESDDMLDESIRDAVWKAWRTDEFMAPREKHHSELKGKAKEEFDNHVSAVEAHAKKHDIKKPMDAVIHHADHLIRKAMKKEDLDEARRSSLGKILLRDIKQSEKRASGEAGKDIEKHFSKQNEKKWRESPEFYAAPHLRKEAAHDIANKLLKNKFLNQG